MEIDTSLKFVTGQGYLYLLHFSSYENVDQLYGIKLRSIGVFVFHVAYLYCKNKKISQNYQSLLT